MSVCAPPTHHACSWGEVVPPLQWQGGLHEEQGHNHSYEWEKEELEALFFPLQWELFVCPPFPRPLTNAPGCLV